MPLDNIDYGSGQDTMQDVFDKTNLAIDDINTVNTQTIIENVSNVFITLDYKTVNVSLAGYSTSTLASGATLYILPSGVRTTTAYNIGASFSAFVSGGGAAQSSLTFPVNINTQTGVISCMTNMPPSTNLVYGSFSYLKLD
jgi:hypothetical protein